MSKYYCKNCGGWPLHGRGLCEPCYFADYYQRNRDKIRVRAKKWREQNREEYLKYQREYGAKYRAERRRIKDESRMR